MKSFVFAAVAVLGLLLGPALHVAPAAASKTFLQEASQNGGDH